MPFAQNDETKIYYETHGAGEPLLMIMGLGGSRKEWRRLLPFLTEKYQTIIFDNRGTGDTEFPIAEPFTIPNMARDAKAVLDAENIESAHVLGMSMGGMIAQEFALTYPEKVRSQILAVTHCGVAHAVHAKSEVLFTLQGRGANSPEEAFWAMVPYIYDKTTPREKIAEDLAMREGKFTAPENFMRQLQALISWQGSFDRLKQINAPTLILHGENDQLIPCANAKILADVISNSKLARLENTSHIFTTDQTEKSAEAILEFLENR